MNATATEFRGFVPEPNCGRGTLGIIWNCLSTLFLVIWVSCHTETLRPWSTDSWLYTEKLRQALGFLLLPEGGALLSIRSLVFGVRLRRQLREIPGWEHFSLKQAFLLTLLEGVYRKDNSEKISETEFVLMAQDGRLHPDDFPTDDEIEDRSKSSGILKAISISQTLWFMVNTAWRLREDYQISLVEDITIAHSFCGLVMFLAWFRCPQDIHRPFCLPVRDEATAATSKTTRSPTAADVSVDLDRWTKITIVTLLFGIFTGIHLGAWNYPFSTVQEAWIWRLCSIMIFVIGLLIYVLSEYVDELGVCITIDQDIPFAIVVILYGMVRLALVVIAFMAFRRAPASVYDKPTWSSYWPHLG